MGRAATRIVQAAFTGGRLDPLRMRAHCLFPILIIGSLALPALPATAAEATARTCLNKADQRAAVASRRAIPLSEAVKHAHRQGRKGELVRARLCRRGDGLVYVLTLLPRSGKVMRISINAANGDLVAGR